MPLKLNVGLSYSFVRQAQMWDPALLALFARLVAQPGVELIGVEPYHSFLFLADLPHFVTRMRWMHTAMEHLFGQRPRVTDTTELCMSDGIAVALAHAERRRKHVLAHAHRGRNWIVLGPERLPLFTFREPLVVESAFGQPLHVGRGGARGRGGVGWPDLVAGGADPAAGRGHPGRGGPHRRPRAVGSVRRP